MSRLARKQGEQHLLHHIELVARRRRSSGLCSGRGIRTRPDPASATEPRAAASASYQLNVVQEVLLALLASEPAHGYQLQARLQLALGPLADALNGGHVYVTLSRLEKAGLVVAGEIHRSDRPNRKVYELTAAGRERVLAWLEDVSWPKPAPAEFHLKMVAAA